MYLDIKTKNDRAKLRLKLQLKSAHFRRLKLKLKLQERWLLPTERASAVKTIVWWKKSWQYVQPFWYNTRVWQTDWRTDRIWIAKTWTSTRLMHVKNGCSYSTFQRSFDWKWELTVDTRTVVASVLIAVDRRTKLIARCIDRLIDAPSFWNIAGFIIPHLCLAPPQGVTPSEFREYFLYTQN